jgi:serine protease
MKRLAGIVAALLIASPLAAEETQRYLVGSRAGTSAAAGIGSLAASTASPRHQLRRFRNANAYAANLTEAEVAELRGRRDVVVEPIVAREIEEVGTPGARNIASTAATEAQSTPWGVASIHAPQVWSATRGENVNVAVLDTGSDADHRDLKAAYAGGYNTFQPLKPPVDGHRHGTHVSGIIAAADDAVGVVGVAPKVRLWAVKVLEDTGAGTNESVVAGLEWVMEKAKTTPGRWVVNMSLGSNIRSIIEEQAVRETISRNIVVVAAAGNRNLDELRYPARYSGVIAVGATTEEGTRADFSSYGVGLAVMAPGALVPSTIIKGYADSADVVRANATTVASIVLGSAYGSATARVIDCGIGEPQDFPAEVRGNIALVRRGKLVFREKARNAKEAGAAAVILQSYEEETTYGPSWTLLSDTDPEYEGYAFPLTVRLLYDDAEALLQSSAPVTVTYRYSEWATLSGTSMSSPHVAGTTALLLSLAPQMTVAQIDYVLRTTAKDMYGAGWDPESSWGQVDAFAAAKWVAPERFGVPAPEPEPVSRRRSVGH